MPAKDVPKRIADRFDVSHKLGEGSFGEVYRGVDEKTGVQVAVKFEESSSAAPGSLKKEFEILEHLRRPFQRHGYADVHHFSRQGKWSVMVMELLGHSLEDSLRACGGKFKVSSAVLVAEQVLHRIEYLHSKGIVHRDIKPENFMWGVGRKVHHLYLIDFGLSIRYWDKKHIGMSSRRQSLTGTARYASINSHRGCTQSRRDDLEAIGHMLLYFLRGSLPWSGLKANSPEERFHKIMETKERYPLAELCKGFPKEFETFLRVTRAMQFRQCPDYDRFLKMFRDLREREGVKEDWDFEWLRGKDIDFESLIPMDPGFDHEQPDSARNAEEHKKSPSTWNMCPRRSVLQLLETLRGHTQRWRQSRRSSRQ